MKSCRFAGSLNLYLSGAVGAAVALSLVAARSASAETTYGTLSNFDVFNDTGQECHGFEIELDGVSSADVSYTFGSPYERYGNPHVVDFPGGVYIRYESPYDPVNHVFTETTPMAPAVITPTDGHACWVNGSANYLTSGCEHFGIGLAGNPTNTVYRWLVADPINAGSLQPSGTKVSIPAPVWNVSPPIGGGGPVVQAVLPAEPPEVNQQYGDAQWVKVYVTESPNPAHLEHLLSDDPAVPQDGAETEVEWTILQAGPEGAGNNELINEGAVAADAESVTRRYEFYEYTGAYDPESHEVMCGGDGGCNTPLDGELGNYIGAQMAAVNLAPIAPPAQVQLVVSQAGNGSGTVTSTPAGIDCGAACTASFDQGSLVTLTAAAAADSFFGGFGGACSGSAPTTGITLDAPASCSATFHLQSESAGLEVTATQKTKKPRAGHRIAYGAQVQNHGPAAATAATLAVTFTGVPAADLPSIKAPKGCTVAGPAMSCNLGNIKPGKSVKRNVSVKPGAAGTIDVAVAAASAAPNANPAAASDDVTTIVP